MKDNETRELLKSEYLHLHKVIVDFDGRAITIKAWSVSFSLVALVGAFTTHAAPVLLISSLSALLFWLIEGYWKTFQYAHYDRMRVIEDYFRSERRTIVPLQINTSWIKKWRTEGSKHLARVMAWPYVALPHALVVILGIVLYWLAGLQVIKI
jgi:hypothetical protein